jgi:hypothetical protein
MKCVSIINQCGMVILGLIFSASIWAHGGAAGTDTDQCKFELEPNHWIHYTAYQPKAYPAKDFCGNIPSLSTLTQLVFDYQDMQYRDRSIEFEVTKEPEGTRVFFEEAKKHKSGTVVLALPNGVTEVGKYLIHITLLQDSGERLDAHMSFVAGNGEPTPSTTYGLYLLFLGCGLYVVYLSSPGFKGFIDNSINKVKA